MKKLFSSTVIVMTICWALGLAALAPVAQAATLVSGDLIKASSPSVYYYGENGKRYVFPDLKTYQTWYGDDFSTIKKITDAELANIMIGGNVTHRPGVKMIKINTDPTVYAISKGGTLRKIGSEAIAACIFGSNWASLVNDISDAFFVNYKMGAEITNCSDYDKAAELAATPTINTDKSLLQAPIEIVSCSDINCLINLAQTCQKGELSYHASGPFPLVEGLMYEGTTYFKIDGKDANGVCTFIQQSKGGSFTLTPEGRQAAIGRGMTEAEIDAELQTMNESINDEAVLASISTCSGTSANVATYMTNMTQETDDLSINLSCTIGINESICTYEPDITCVISNGLTQ